MVKYNTKSLKRMYEQVKKNKMYMIVIVILFFIFGKTGVGSRILTFPLLRYFVLYFIVNYRIKDPWTSIYVVLFVFACFQLVSYIDIDGEPDEEYDEDSDEIEEE